MATHAAQAGCLEALRNGPRNVNLEAELAPVGSRSLLKMKVGIRSLDEEPHPQSKCRVKAQAAYFAEDIVAEAAGCSEKPATLLCSEKQSPVENGTGSNSGHVGEFVRSQSQFVCNAIDDLDALKANLVMVQKSLEAFAHNGSPDAGATAGFNSGMTRLASLASAERVRRGSFSILRDASQSVSAPLAMGCAGSHVTDDQERSRAGSKQPKFVAEALPLDWPKSLPFRDGLDDLVMTRGASKATLSRAGSMKTQSSPTRSSPPSRKFLSEDKLKSRSEKAAFRRRMQRVTRFFNKARDPESRLRVAWKVLNATVLVYEAALVPYLLGFSVAFNGWVTQQLLFMASFWTLDLLLNFIQGYEKDGMIVMDYKRAAKRYIKTGFPLDAIVVLLDWSTLSIIWSNTDGRLDLVARVLRLLRMAGLLRLQKLARIVGFHVLTSDIDALHSIGGLVAVIIGCYLLFNHLQACVWAYIGWNAPSDTGAHWVDTPLLVGNVELLIEELNPVYQYTCIFHWHMAQLTVGNQGIPTSSSLERIVNIVGLLVALMIACTVVSMLSATLVSFQFSVRQRTQQLRTLEAYLRENNVCRRLRARAITQARERARKSAKLRFQDVQIMNLLSTTLQTELCYEVARGALQTHPLLRLWIRLDLVSAKNLSVVATSFEIVLPHERVFEAAEEAQRVCQLCAGKAEYRQYPRSFNCSAEQAFEVVQGAWVSEAALWAEWLHVGSFEALAPCEIFTINVEQWMRALSGAHSLREVISDYASQFYRRLVNAVPPVAPWPDDLKVPFTEYGELVCTMAHTSQEIIGMDVLSEAMLQRTLRIEMLEKLESQLLDGQCVLYLDRFGQPKRVTSGVSIAIEREDDGRILFQIGKVKDEKVSPSMMVPGHMSERDELPSESLQRLLGSKLRPLHFDIKVLEATHEVNTRMSLDFGILTDYMQLKFSAVLDPRFEIPDEYRACGDRDAHCPVSKPTRSTLTSLPTTGYIDLEDLPETFIFPGEREGTSYCCAWLTEIEFVKWKGKPDFVVKWLTSAFREFMLKQEEAANRTPNQTPTRAGPTPAVFLSGSEEMGLSVSAQVVTGHFLTSHVSSDASLLSVGDAGLLEQRRSVPTLRTTLSPTRPVFEEDDAELFRESV